MKRPEYKIELTAGCRLLVTASDGAITYYDFIGMSSNGDIVLESSSPNMANLRIPFKRIVNKQGATDSSAYRTLIADQIDTCVP